MISTEYKEAMAEVLCVLKHCDEQVIAKIPLEVIKNLKQNAVEIEGIEDKFEQFHDDISDINLSQEAIALLAAIYRKYLCTDEEKIEYDKKLLTAQELLGQEGLSDNLFDSKPKNETNEFKDTGNLPKEIKRENFFSRLIQKIRHIFGNK